MLKIIHPLSAKICIIKKCPHKFVSLYWLFIFFSYFSVMTTATPEKAEGLKALQTACDEIQQTITNSGGVFQIKMAVCILKTRLVTFRLKDFIAKHSNSKRHWYFGFLVDPQMSLWGSREQNSVLR